MSAPLLRVGDRLCTPSGLVWRVVCRGETFLTLESEGAPLESRLYVPLREWPLWADTFTPLPWPGR